MLWQHIIRVSAWRAKHFSLRLSRATICEACAQPMPGHSTPSSPSSRSVTCAGRTRPSRHAAGTIMMWKGWKGYRPHWRVLALCSGGGRAQSLMLRVCPRVSRSRMGTRRTPRDWTRPCDSSPSACDRDVTLLGLSQPVHIRSFR